MNLDGRVKQTALAVQRQWRQKPRMGLILGTGLGKFAEHIRADATIPYRDLPGFPRSTAPGHRGRLICGQLAGCSLVAMDGRCHIYEGYRAAEVCFPVQVMGAMGARLLFVSNASGGLHARFSPGDLLLVRDHIDLMGRRSIGFSNSPVGRPARIAASPYDPALIELAQTIARREGIPVDKGVYVAMTGPSYETRAEYRFLRRIGGDVVGMSTVPEVTVAAAAGMRILAVSVITNVASPDIQDRVQSDHVTATAAGAAANLGKIVQGVASRLAEDA